MKPSLLSIKVYCVCGQKYAFEVQPQAGKMPVPVACPTCERDGTDDANKIISKTLNGETRKLPPPSVNTLLNSAQSSLPLGLVEALKDAVVQELAAQRRELLAAQQAATTELTQLALRFESVQNPLLERLHAYERRVAELEKELGEQAQQNRELLKLKIEELREQVKAERTQSRIKFN